MGTKKSLNDFRKAAAKELMLTGYYDEAANAAEDLESRWRW